MCFSRACSLNVLRSETWHTRCELQARMCIVRAMTRCRGMTRAGKPCSVTSASSWIDDGGRLVSEPLRRGGEYCALHARPFVVRPAAADVARAVIVFLDLEILVSIAYTF